MNNLLLKPKRLSKSDKVALISPASPATNPEKIIIASEYLTSKGFKVVYGSNLNKSHKYLAGTDLERSDDFNKAFSTPDINAIFCLRGGYGSGRLLESIDYNTIKKYPKIFVGYSDITSLHLSLHRKCNMVTFSGPMPAVDFQSEIDPITESYFWDLMLKKNFWKKQSFNNERRLSFLVEGNAEGVMVGGNLTTLASLIGTKYFPNLKNKILFLEDIGEAPYRLDRMLNQLKLCGLLKKLSGIILGGFTDCVKPKSMNESFTVKEIFEHYFSELGIPVIVDFPHGHLKQMVTLAMGTAIRISSKGNSFSYLEDPFE